MKKLDLTGQKYGNLTVIEEAEPYRQPSGKKIIMWKCLCDCGKEVVVRACNLRSGHTKSCGCLAGREDIIGKRFGRLVVKAYDGNSHYLCDCDCGVEVSVDTSNLKSGNTKSCGCLQRERTSEATFKSLVGQRFGKLTVIERVQNNRFNHTCYKCKCDCGGITIVDSGNLRQGNTNSCGCIKSKGEMRIHQILQKYNVKYISQYSLDDIVLDSNRRPFFDFAIFDKENNLKCLIEYNGKQHYTYSNNGWDNKENFEKTQHRDKQKREICKRKGILLYEIPYTKYNFLEEELLKVLEGIAKVNAEAPDMEEAQEAFNE